MGTERQGPPTIEYTRGPAVESRHLVDAAEADPARRLAQGWDKTEAVVYTRSAIKSAQVLPLFETGAAERYAVSDEELALAGYSSLAANRSMSRSCRTDSRAPERAGPHPVHNMCSRASTAPSW